MMAPTNSLARSTIRLFSLAALSLLSIAAISRAADSAVISEFMAAGQFAIADEDGEYPDWLEIHNTGAAPLNLTGWHLTDKIDAPTKWTLPAVALPPDGYLLIFADGKNRTNPAARLHTNFSLNADGEYLALTHPDGSVAFRFDPYPLQLPDVAFDDAGHFLGNPTPGAANDPAEVAMAAAPLFSQPHGIRKVAFALKLRTSTPGAQIRYTLNGTEPSETAGKLYTAPIPIAKTSVVRAVAFTSTAKTSPV